MSGWKYGCGKKFETAVPTRFSCKTVMATCGSTAWNGGVNQCDACATKQELMPPPTPDYGDDDYDDYSSRYDF